MSTTDLMAAAAIAAAAACTVRYLLIRRKKRRKGCKGCPYADMCGGECEDNGKQT